MSEIARYTLPKNPLADHMEGRARRLRVRTRSRLVGGVFQLVNTLTRYDIEGRENLLAAAARARETGRGLITVSNHVSLFDDPMVILKLVGLRNFTVETKAWWSTACASNFNPAGRSIGSRVVRAFGETANMVFMARAHKGRHADRLPESLAGMLGPRLGWKRLERAAERARRDGVDLETWLRRFVTAGPDETPTSLDQLGLLEACVRTNVGDWLHFFPEGGRSRNLALRPARPGVGKVLYNAPEAEVVPICFYGTQDILPVGAVVPRPFQRVVVSVGRPLNRSILESLRRDSATVETFGELSRFAMSGVAALRPGVLARYLGAEAAFHLLAEEHADALQYADAGQYGDAMVQPSRSPSTETVPWAAIEDASERAETGTERLS